jgi:ArsR family transcriptional regulator
MEALTWAQHINLMFRAFSEPTRLRILRLLQGGECCVGDLVTILHVPQPSVSRHLAYLRRAGLVGVRTAGPWKYYRLTPASSAFHENLLHCLESCFADVPDLRADAKRAAKLRKSGGCCPE